MLKLLFAFILCIIGFAATLFVDPFWGLAVFSVFTHITPQQLSIQYIVPLRIPFILSISTFLFYLINSKYPHKFAVRPLEFWLMILMLFGMLLGTLNAVNSELIYIETDAFLKYIVFYLLLVNIVNSEWKIYWFINAQILSAAWLVYRCWDLKDRFRDRFENTDGGVISDSNHFAAAVVLLFPLVVRRILVGHWLTRLGAAIGGFGMIMTIVITGSRGAFLGLIAETCAFIFFYKQFRKRIILVLICFILVIAPLISDYYIERVMGVFKVEDIEDQSAKASAESRLNAWPLAWDIWKDYPLLGCGIGNFGYYMGYRKEGLEWGELGHVAHSVWFEVLGEGGLAVSIPFLLILFYFYKRTFAASKFFLNTSRPSIAEDIYSLQVGMTGFLVCATFLNRLFYEPIYWFSGLAVAYSYMIQREIYASNA